MVKNNSLKLEKYYKPINVLVRDIRIYPKSGKIP